MRTEILLTSEVALKNIIDISDNVAGKYILASIREAQETGLKGIIGAALLEKVKQLIAEQNIDLEENAAYNELVAEAQYYLAYQAGARLQLKVAYKTANAGVVRTTDEHVSAASQDEVARVQQEYQNQADKYARDLQGWLIAHSGQLPELNECRVREIRSCLTSAYSGGLWLGGGRGKR